MLKYINVRTQQVAYVGKPAFQGFRHTDVDRFTSEAERSTPDSVRDHVSTYSDTGSSYCEDVAMAAIQGISDDDDMFKEIMKIQEDLHACKEHYYADTTRQ